MKKLLLTATLASLTATSAQAQLFQIDKKAAEKAGFSLPAPATNNKASNATASSKTSNAAPAVQDLTTYFDNTRDLQGHFTQTLFVNKGIQQSGGEMYLSKPGKFYWDYQTPDHQKIISNGKNVWQYDLDLEQIAVRKREELVGDIAIQILTGQAKLASLFKIEGVPFAQVPKILEKLGTDASYYRLTPKKNQEAYNNIWVVMRDGGLRAIAVDGGRGQQTVIAFQNLKRNVGIPASQFEFTPPKGVDIVGG